MPRKLRVVDPSENPAVQYKTVKEAAASGDQRALLVSLRARISSDIDDPNTPARDLAALSRRLLEIAKEIKAIDAANDETDGVSVAAAAPDEAWQVK